MIMASLGANVFYFLSAPMWRLMTGEDNSSHEALGKRRRSLVEYLGQAVFQDRALGARMAAEVLAASPMPEKIRLTKDPEER
jgi:TetR/AcrR family transcriptional regulator